jgi:hypothetical protein
MNVVEKIHNEIDTAQDRLYNEAVSFINTTDSFKERVEKSERLKRVGFTSTETVVQTEKEKQISDDAKNKADLIVYYRTAYPFLKFLTLDEMDKICEKYDLIYAPVQNYKKDVPEKNLRDIENAQVLNKKDLRHPTYTYDITDSFSYVPDSVIKFVKNLVTETQLTEDREFRDLCPIKYNERWLWTLGGLTTTKTSYEGLFIAAPKSHFDLENLTEKKKGFFRTEIFKQEPKDPIVFRHVVGGIQVLTKWGDEANDPLLINPINN